jgi:DNA-binding transcriptional LysR family regulator
LYVFGGGDASGQLDGIVRVDASGATANVGSLPSASSDSAAAVVDGTAYIVGGYDGTQWLDTIVAYSPGSPARIVAHLPTPVRYAAVGAVAGRIVIAGGSTPSARATSSVYVFDPHRLTVDRLRDLPAALTHASAAGVGHRAQSQRGEGGRVVMGAFEFRDGKRRLDRENDRAGRSPGRDAGRSVLDDEARPRFDTERLVEADNEYVIVNLVESGVGASLVREVMAIPSSQEGLIAIVPGMYVDTALCLAYQASRRDDPLPWEAIDRVSDASRKA